MGQSALANLSTRRVQVVESRICFDCDAFISTAAADAIIAVVVVS